jgi:hypothetical protein
LVFHDSILQEMEPPPKSVRFNTALGPASIGFQTDGTNIARGAEIAGNEVGVKGSSNLGPGLVGESSSNKAVIGRSQSATGVEGMSGGDRTGVKGVSQRGFGVVGQGLARHGVVGISGGFIPVDDASDAIYDEPMFKAPTTPSRTGVLGIAENGTGVFGSGESAGVSGLSVRGDGIHGASVLGRGGVFEAGGPRRRRPIPQVQLVAQAMPVGAELPANPVMRDPNELSGLPRDGRTGDVLATVAPRTQFTSAVAYLWFCVEGNSSRAPAKWAQILLGDSFEGKS